MSDFENLEIETGCLTGNCGTCTLCIDGKVMKARWEAYESLLCPGCKVVKSVSSRRYSHEELWSAENKAYEVGAGLEHDATQIYGRGYAEGWGGSGGDAIIAFLDSLRAKEHHV